MIAIIDYDAGNIKSVEKALNYLGEEAIITRDHDEIVNSDKVILPGVGAFDLVLIRERRPGAHDHDRQHHSHTEHQAQNLLLGELLIPQCFAPQFPTDFPRRSHAIISIF